MHVIKITIELLLMRFNGRNKFLLKLHFFSYVYKNTKIHKHLWSVNNTDCVD